MYYNFKILQRERSQHLHFATSELCTQNTTANSMVDLEMSGVNVQQPCHKRASFAASCKPLSTPNKHLETIPRIPIAN